jgi:hypothetical protein
MKDVLSLETPAIANYTTGEVMGHSSDRLVRAFVSVVEKGALVFCLCVGRWCRCHCYVEWVTPSPTQTQNANAKRARTHTHTQAAKFGVSRREQDEFAAMSHQRAAKAHKEGIYKVCVYMCW